MNVERARKNFAALAEEYWWSETRAGTLDVPTRGARRHHVGP